MTLFRRYRLRRLYRARRTALYRVEDAKARRDTRDIHHAQIALKAVNLACLKLEVG